MEDPDFGAIEHHIDAWDGEIAFDRAVSGTQRLRVHLRSGTNGPSKEQRQLFGELKRRYNSLWPEIAGRILLLRREVGDVATLPALLNPRVGLSIPGVIGDQLVDFTLVYEFTGDLTRKGYFISFVPWSIERADEAK